MDHLKVSVVIPCYNDGGYIKPVIDSLKSSDYCGELIVVDDGSEKETQEILNNLQGVKLIRHQRNRGKSQALKSGIEAAYFKQISFIDSDLKGFQTNHFNILVEKMIFGSFDMVIGAREGDDYLSYFSNFIGFTQAYGGERIFKDKDQLLKGNFFKVDNYLIEPEINKYFFKKKKVGAVFLKGVDHVFKFKKDKRKGIIRDLDMLKSYLLYLGPKELSFQMNFARKLLKLADRKD